MSIACDNVTIGIDGTISETGAMDIYMLSKYKGENGVTVANNKVGLSYDTAALSVVQDTESKEYKLTTIDNEV